MACKRMKAVAGVALVNPSRDDVLYGLGSGDGRIVIGDAVKVPPAARR